MKYSIIADDLTGACDAGARFLPLGLPVLVTLSEAADDIDEDHLSVICTCTRGARGDAAARRTGAALESITKAGGQVIYKKIDSTLNGNLATEVVVCRVKLGDPLVVVAPAHPEMNRALVGGRLRLNGIQQPGPSLTELLADHSGVPASLISVEEVERGPAHLASCFCRVKQSGQGILVVDSQEVFHLKTVAAAIAQCRADVLPVGSSGLATALAETDSVSVAALQSDRNRPLPHQSGTPSVLVVGSSNPVTWTQVEHLVQNQPCDLTALADLESNRYESAMRSGQHLIIKCNWMEKEQGALARLAEMISAFPPNCVLLCGGDTAEAFLLAAGITALWVHTEVLPGVVQSWVSGGPFANLSIVTKPGGFGAVRTLADVMARLYAVPMKSESRRPGRS